jgi:hypothetical protein
VVILPQTVTLQLLLRDIQQFLAEALNANTENNKKAEKILIDFFMLKILKSD